MRSVLKELRLKKDTKAGDVEVWIAQSVA